MSRYDQILRDVLAERERADVKYPQYARLPDGTRNGGMNVHVLRMARLRLARHVAEGTVTHANPFECEVAEVMAEEDPEKLRVELVQVAAYCVRWVACLDERKADAGLAWRGSFLGGHWEATT